MGKERKLPIGLQSFAQIIKNEYVYAAKTRLVYNILLQLMVTLCCHPFIADAKMINSTNFESCEPNAPYTLDKWNEAGFQTGTWDNGLAERTLIDNTNESKSGTKSLRIFYPQGSLGPDQNGAQVELKFTPRKEAYTSYFLRFSENFSFGNTSEGGKLPGLCGGDNCSGGSSCDGSNGFSARLMWREGGRLVLYLYHMDKPASYGEDFDLLYPDGSSVIAKKGEWLHIAERVKINTDGNSFDGEVEIWVNGKHVLLLEGLRFTSNGDMVDKLYISTFHGGDTSEWAPTNNCYTWLDDIRIGTTFDDVSFQTCSKQDIRNKYALCAEKNISLQARENDNVTHIWLKDGTIISTDNNYTVSQVGKYTLVSDSAWCSTKEHFIVEEKATAKITGEKNICETSFTVLTSEIQHPSFSYQWEKNSSILTNEKNATLKIKDAGKYKLTISSVSCGESSDETIVTSGLLTVKDIVGASGTPFELEVEENGENYGWYNENQLLLETGKTFSGNIGIEKETYYVKDLSSFSGHVGMKRLSVGSSYTEDRFDRKMKFEVFSELTIDSLTIYLVDDQDIAIHITSLDGNTTYTTVEYTNLSAGEQRIALNATLSPGVYYMDAQGSTGRLRHSNEKDMIEFPYTVDGVISIMGSSLPWIDDKPWYLFFYNWKITAGNSCAATPVYINVDKVSSIPLIKSIVDSPSLKVYATQNHRDFIVEEGVKKIGKNSLHVYDSMGHTCQFSITNVPQGYKITLPHKGVYIVNANGESVMIVCK